MKTAEKDCHKYIKGHIEWCPETGVWMKRCWLLRQVQVFLNSRTRDPQNLFADCCKHGIMDPWQITQDELNVEFFICKQNLEYLVKHGPRMCREFLNKLIHNAKRKGDQARATKIATILQHKKLRKYWHHIYQSTWKPWGGLTIAVKVPHKDSAGKDQYTKYKTEDGTFLAVSKTLVEQFQSALVAQCYHGTFFEEIGHLADGPVAQQIILGTYQYPPYLDPATRLLFEEATATYARLSPSGVATYVTVKDFQYFWQRAREGIGSPYSGLHFGHYKRASFCTNLSALHASKLSLVARKGIPLSQWNRGLTVLLKKIVGNVFVHKLRAICLLEADFNWWNKLIFAKTMMQQAINEGSIPQLCFAKKNSHCNYAVLRKQFFCNSSRTWHHPVGLGECDFSDCYDQAAHPPTSIALPRWQIPVMVIRVLLTSMQVMQYFLKTGFGKSSKSYGGTSDSPNSGLGQRSGASPPGFLVLSLLIVNAYRFQGHNAKITLAFVEQLFSLAAVMYIDDTEILH